LFQWLKTMLNPSPYQPKTREAFPQSGGWIELKNSRSADLTILIEPWGQGFDLKPGEACHVHLAPNGEQPLLDFTDGVYLVLWCCDAIYQNNTEVYDFQDENSAEAV